MTLRSTFALAVLVLGGGQVLSACRGSDTDPHTADSALATVYASNGARIFYTAASASGSPILVSARFGLTPVPATRSCADCHGADGGGLQIETDSGIVQTPVIQFAHLATPGAYAGGRSYDEATLALTLRTGVRVDGYLMSGVMPRFTLSAQDMSDLIAHLKTLGAGRAGSR